MLKRKLGILLILTLAIPIFHFHAEGNGLPEWTIMIYLDGDNNLEKYGIDDFVEMASVGSTADMNVLVQLDRIANYDGRYDDWTDAKRFLVQEGMVPDSTSAILSLGEVDMSDPLVLFDFMNWSATNYEANKYFLIIWDHGAGWEGIVNDATNSPGNLMSTPELALALDMFRNSTGRKVDVVGFDACRMMTETIYEIREHADFLVGSEKDVPDRGFPYDAFLASVAALPEMTPHRASAELVDAYVEFYTGNTAFAVTLSSVRSSYMDDLKARLNIFLNETFLELPLFSEEMRDARLDSERYEGDSQYDLYDFLENVQSHVPSGRLGDLAEDVKRTIWGAVYERKWDNPNSQNSRATNAHGLTIWLPLSITNSKYLDLAWSDDTLWDEFLDFYNDNFAKPRASLGVDDSLLDMDGDGYTDGISLNMSSDTDGELSVDVYDEFAGKYLSTHTYTLASNIEQEDVIALPNNIHATLSFYLGNQSGVLLNHTEITVPKLLKILGTVKDTNGEYVQVDITLSNARTLSNMSAVSGSSGFEFSVLYPIWAGKGDTLELRFVHNSEVKTFQIRPDFARSTFSIHVAVEAEEPGDGNGFPYAGLAIVAIQVLAMVLALRMHQKRKITL